MRSPFVSDKPKRRRRRWPFVLAGLALLGAVAALGAYLLFFQEESDFSDPGAEFQAEPEDKPGKKPKPERFKWPIYGYTPDRARFLNRRVTPPAKRLWKFTGSNGLIEFQPVLANGHPLLRQQQRRGLGREREERQAPLAAQGGQAQRVVARVAQGSGCSWSRCRARSPR